mmetsp:Transcript_8906/g.20328  ORF Transcript_8906/g.20328 Transcript_8906/m.20328 type:complete len:450 (-) Transcript_8906:94-1443(-)
MSLDLSFSPSKAMSPKAKYTDRFIPRRLDIVSDLSVFQQQENGKINSNDVETSPTKQDYKRALKELVYPYMSPNEKLLSLSASLSPASPSKGLGSYTVNDLPTSPSLSSPSKKKISRFIPKSADKILDAPQIVDDYYLNLLDWSPTNVLAVALNQSVFLWNASTGAAHKLMQTDGRGDIITSLSWGSGNTLAVGTHSAEIQLWDVSTSALVRTLRGHEQRVSSLTWSSGSSLSSGSRDCQIIHHDTRANNHKIASLHGHRHEVCGLKWSPQANQLASGGNDNVLYIWEARNNRPRLCIERHRAAVKALAWCPFQHNTLASGGGTADRKICLWNTSNGTCFNEVDTKSQVCAIEWSIHDKEFVSSHGFTHNQLILWRHYGSGRLQKVTELTGHQARVLHMAKSPDGTTVVSAAADETIRFWRIFGAGRNSASKLKDEQASRSLLGANSIR